MDLGIVGRVALVSGGSRGIGRAIALELAREGASVSIAARGEADLAHTLDELRTVAGETRVHAVRSDLATVAGCESFVDETARRFGRVDILVCNTGGSRGDPTFTAPESDWDSVFDLNFRAAVRLVRRAVPEMRRSGGGRIVNVSSIFGREWGGAVSYNAAKAALIAFTKSLARELVREGILVNSVAPGSVLHPGGSWDRRQRENPQAIAEFVKRDLPLGRFGTPEEIAAVVAFLCSSRASLVAGACINVDGGQSRSLF
ncbi:MAG: SDR family oxidoreductase [Planctomycetes bacterium]|nr:SDR family oxidoreductase [Planctomycetota bacterium]MBI3844992.1 SDR family oxidoreductase [Planctomycetota bacterium]